MPNITERLRELYRRYRAYMRGVVGADYAFERWCKPQLVRMQAAGMSLEDMNRLFDAALKYANPEIVGGAPGSILRNMADRVEAGESAADILGDGQQAAADEPPAAEG